MAPLPHIHHDTSPAEVSFFISFFFYVANYLFNHGTTTVYLAPPPPPHIHHDVSPADALVSFTISFLL
jgi:hypothetical protein